MNQGHWGGGGGQGPSSGGRQEVPFFTDNIVTITNARAIILGTTYALANITSVRSWSVPKSASPLLVGILCLLTGVAIALAGGGACGGVVLLVGVAATVSYFASKDHHYVRIGTAGGEVNALQSTNPTYINQVVTALNNAIIHRG